MILYLLWPRHSMYQPCYLSETSPRSWPHLRNQDFDEEADKDSQDMERAMYLMGHYSRICLTTAAIGCSLNGPAATAFNILSHFTSLSSSWLKGGLQIVLILCAIMSLAFIPALVYVVKIACCIQHLQQVNVAWFDTNTTKQQPYSSIGSSLKSLFAHLWSCLLGLV